MADPLQTVIDALAASPDGASKHAAFIYGVLREPLFDSVLMASAMANVPLTAEAMRYVAEHWNDEEAPRG